MAEGSKECRSPKYPVSGEWSPVGDKSSKKMHERAGRGGGGRTQHVADSKKPRRRDGSSRLGGIRKTRTDADRYVTHRLNVGHTPTHPRARARTHTHENRDHTPCCILTIISKNPWPIIADIKGE
jgi:hypothetical protein